MTELIDPLWLVYTFVGVTALAVGVAPATKRKGARLGRHGARGRIVRELKRDPGARVQELCRRLGLARGTARYHLYVLERAGAIESAAPPGRHHYFPAGATDEEIRQLTVLRRQRMAEVVGVILDAPGIRQRVLLEQIGMHRKVFRAYVKELLQENLLLEQRDGRSRRYHATPALLALLDRWAPDEALGPRAPEDGARSPKLAPRGELP